MGRMKRLPQLAVAALLLSGCTSTGYYGLWQPKPLDLTVRNAEDKPVALFSAAVLGRWRGEPYDDEIHVRLRVENLGPVALRLPLERVELLSGDLQTFGGARLVGGQLGEVEPGEIGSYDAGFAPPVEGPDLRGLQLRWVLELDGHELPGSATFQRADPVYYPAYYPSLHVGWGYSHGWGYDGWCASPGGGPVYALPPHVTSAPGKP
jgi:hypothetical protein